MKLRVGIILWILSWIPYPVIFGLSAKATAASWAIAIVVGIVGLALAGTEFAQAVKTVGWKGAPGVAWHALLHGSDIEDAEAAT